MSDISSIATLGAPTLRDTQGRAPASATSSAPPSAEQVARAQETQEAFSRFVGTTFFGQLLKSMRQTVGKPAYFHGGRAEEAFRTQLDQTLATHMTESGGARLAEGMFRQQFPEHADVLGRHEAAGGAPAPGLQQLSALRRW